MMHRFVLNIYTLRAVLVGKGKKRNFSFPIVFDDDFALTWCNRATTTANNIVREFKEKFQLNDAEIRVDLFQMVEIVDWREIDK